MSGQYNLRLAENMPKKMCLAFRKGRGIRVHLFKNSPGGVEHNCSLSHAQIKRYNKLSDGKQKFYFSHSDLQRNHTGGVSIETPSPTPT